MTKEELQNLATAIRSYNSKNAAKCEITEFITYPETRKNGAKMAMRFTTTHWGRTEQSIVEYNSLEQLMKWFAFHG